MNNKFLILEVERINSLMGTQNKFIFEGPLATYIKLTKNAVSNSVDLLDDILKKGLNNIENTKLDLEKVVDDLSDSMDNETIQSLKNFIKNTDDIQKIKNQIIKKIDELTTNVTKFNKTISKLKETINLQKIKLKENLTTLSDMSYSGLKDILEIDLKKMLNDEVDFIEDYPNYRNEIVDNFSKIIDDTMGYSDDLSEEFKKIVQEQIDLTKKEIIDIVDNSELIKKYNEFKTNTLRFKKETATNAEKIIYETFTKGGIFRDKSIKLIRELLNEFLSDKTKLYVQQLSPKELIELKSTFSKLKEKFGNQKLFVTDLEGKTTSLRMTLDDFEKYVDGNYKRIYDEDGKISTLNKLDTNYKDSPDVLLLLMKKILTPDEIETFANKIKSISEIPSSNTTLKTQKLIEIENEWSKISSKIKNESKQTVENWYKNVDIVTSEIKKASIGGDLAENNVNKLLTTKGGAKILYVSSEGSPVDNLLNIDTLFDDNGKIFGGGVKTVQTKKALSIIEGEFQIINVKGEMKSKFVPKSGTGRYLVKTTQKIGKPSQIDLAAFSDVNTGETIICGKQKKWIGYNTDGTPKFSDIEILPGSESSNFFIKYVVIDPDTPKLVGKI